MFFFLAVLAMIAYAVQGTLIVHYARKLDGLSTAIYRNASLTITMLPLLFLAKKSDFVRLPEFLPELLIAGITGAAALSIGFWTLKFLPVGITSALNNSVRVIFIFLLGFYFFGETISWIEILFVALILIGGISLGFQKHHLPHLDENTRKGIFLALLAAAFAAITFFFMSKVARELSPFVAGYFWEVLIGIFALGFGFLRQLITKQKIKKISLLDFGKITLICSPTLLGTGAFAYAVTLGPLGILNAIGTGGVFISILLAHYLYHEKLRFRQWLWICVAVMGIVGLRLVGN